MQLHENVIFYLHSSSSKPWLRSFGTVFYIQVVLFGVRSASSVIWTWYCDLYFIHIRSNDLDNQIKTKWSNFSLCSSEYIYYGSQSVLMLMFREAASAKNRNGPRISRRIPKIIFSIFSERVDIDCYFIIFHHSDVSRPSSRWQVRIFLFLKIGNRVLRKVSCFRFYFRHPPCQPEI